MEIKYDVMIIGAGPGGIFAAYELIKESPNKKILVFDSGKELSSRKCPVSSGEVTRCLHCNPCSIMQGYGGAGSYSDGKFNITNDFGGTLYDKIGKDLSLSLQKEVDSINELFYRKSGSQESFPDLHSSKNSKFHKVCLQNNLQLLNADIRHLGTDKNYLILEQMYQYLVDAGVNFKFNTSVEDWGWQSPNWSIRDNEELYLAPNLIISVGRSGSKWLAKACSTHRIPVTSNRVDLGIRFELPYDVFSDLTDELYESKIVYKTETFEDLVRTFCMNPHGTVVNENTNGITTVNGHSYEDLSKHTNNTNFALLVSQHFTEPFKDSNAYGENIAKLANQLSGGNVIVQRFGDLVKGRRSSKKDLDENTVVPTLKTAVAGDVSLCLPHRFCQDIIEMIYALDKVAPGTANPDNLLYATEVKFYNSEVCVDSNLEVNTDSYRGGHLYIIGDGSGITHSLSQAAASGLHVARHILSKSEETEIE